MATAGGGRSGRRRDDLASGSVEPVPAEVELAQLAARQYGIFTRAQALRAGVSEGTCMRRLRAGLWVACHRGVYRFAAAPASWEGALLAACFAWGPGAAASHRSAAAVWDLSGFDPARTTIELTVPRKRDRALPHQVHRPESLPARDVVRHGPLPVTTIPRTLLDLAAIERIEVVREALDDALRRRLTTAALLFAQLDRSPGRRKGAGRLRALLEMPDAGVPESVLERRVLQLLLEAGLPPPVPQHVIRARGRVIARVDLAYPEERLAIEADSFRWHAIRPDFERDARRHSRLAALGWRIVRVTWTELRAHPDMVVATVRAALQRSS